MTWNFGQRDSGFRRLDRKPLKLRDLFLVTPADHKIRLWWKGERCGLLESIGIILVVFFILLS